jgi:5-methylcytosine-specific restriction endonuclease McrA
VLGAIELDHRPPIALREPGDDLNDPDRLAAICTRCHARKTARDLKLIAKAKRLADAYQNHQTKLAEKVPGRGATSRAQDRRLAEWIARFTAKR